MNNSCQLLLGSGFTSHKVCSTKVESNLIPQDYIQKIDSIVNTELVLNSEINNSNNQVHNYIDIKSLRFDTNSIEERAQKQIIDYYSLRTAIKCFFSQDYGHKQNEMLNKNEAIILAYGIQKFTGWPVKPCHDLAAIIKKNFQFSYPNPLSLKKTILDVVERNPHLTVDRLVNGPLKTAIKANSRAANHLSEHGRFVFKAEIKPSTLILEWLISTFSPLLCLEKNQLEQGAKIANEIRAIDKEIDMISKNMDDYSPNSKRLAIKDIHCLKSWKALLESPKSVDKWSEFLEAIEKRKDFIGNRNKSIATLLAERVYENQVSSGGKKIDSLPLLPLTSGAAVTAGSLIHSNGIGKKSFVIATIGVVGGLVGGAGYAIYSALQSSSAKRSHDPVDTPLAATFKPSNAALHETTYQKVIGNQSMISDSNAAFASLQNALDSGLSAVIADDKGRLWVPSLSDNLRELHKRYGDSPAFLESALTLLQNNGLLESFDKLVHEYSEGASKRAIPAGGPSFEMDRVKELQNRNRENVPFFRSRALVNSNEVLPNQESLTQEPGDETVAVLGRKRRATPVLETPDTGQQVHFGSSRKSFKINILNQLIDIKENERLQSKSVYLNQWRDSLPRESSLSWLREADKDKQMVYKDLLDYVASAEMSLKRTAQQILSEQPGMSEINTKLHRMDLPQSPNLIRLKASVTHRAGSLSMPVPTDMSLAEAWFSGMLDRMLSASDLVVGNQQERQYLDYQKLKDFRKEFHGIASPPSTRELMKDTRVQHDFGKLTDDYFALKTLEAELKGALRSNDHIRGLEIVNKFRQGSSDVKAGQLTFSMRDAYHKELRVPLSGWLVLQDSANSYVLYDADLNTGSHYFPNKDSMLQFISKKALSDNVAAGRLKDAVLAEQVTDSGQLVEFFTNLAENPDVWRRQKAELIFTPDNSKTFDQAITAFAGRLMARNIALDESDVKTHEAAFMAASLSWNWERVMGKNKMTSLIGFTRDWIKSNSAFGHFLRDKGVYSRAEDFDPDEVYIQAGKTGKTGTITEFAAFMRRQYQGGANFANDIELLPKSVVDNSYVNALTKEGREIFAAELQQVIGDNQAIPKTSLTNGRYIATLLKEDKLNLNNAMQLYKSLNKLQVKSALDEALRTGYPGTLYQQNLKEKLDFSNKENIELRNAWNAAKVAQMQYILERAKNSVTPMPESDANRINQLLKGYPGKINWGYDSLAPLTVGNVRIPEMVMFTLRDNIVPGNRKEFKIKQYVFTPEPINGNHLFLIDDFNALIKRSAIARDIVASKVALKDADNIKEVLKNAGRNRAKAGYDVEPEYDMFTEMVKKLIDDADEQTISQWEVIRDAAVFGAGMMSLPMCLMSGPAAAVMCAAVTSITLADDVNNVSDLWKRGRQGYAIASLLPGLLDITDFTKVLGMAGRAAGIGRAAGYIANKIPDVMKGIPEGVTGLLKKGGLNKFESPMDVTSAMHAGDRYSSAFEDGWLKREWAVMVNPDTYERMIPDSKTAGRFFEKDGVSYILERNYPQEPFLVYQVKIETGGTVRVINPAHPDVPSDRIKWDGVKWVKDTLGLKGGMKLSDEEIINRLQKNKEDIEKIAAVEEACDTKIQSVLKYLVKNEELWNNLEDKLEVRIIKAKSDDVDDEIILHPIGGSYRWQGRYHVYLVVNIDGKKLVIDPYIGGDYSCVSVSEEVFNKNNWKGKAGVDYDVITFAPSREAIVGSDGYTEIYTLRDYIDSRTIFEADTYESHAEFVSKFKNR